jgi:hypothetical protein
MTTALACGLLDRVSRVGSASSDRNDDRILGVVAPAAICPLQRLAEGALEVPEALGADAADAGVPPVTCTTFLPAARCWAARAPRRGSWRARRARRRPRVCAGLRSRRPAPRPHPLDVDAFALFALALADAALFVLAEAKTRELDLRQGDRDVLAPLLADHLARADELAQVLFDAPPDDVAEARVILVDALNHAWSSSRMGETSDLRRSAHCSALASPRAKMLAT